MRSVVSYPERGQGGKSSYRGNCSPKLIEDLIGFYKPQSISDYSCGSGTVEDVAKTLGLVSNCYDLNRGFDLIDDEIEERNDFIFYHPAYWDIIKYSGHQYGHEPLKNDISHIADYGEFCRWMNYSIMKQFSSLKTGGRMAVLVGDIKKQGRLYSMVMDMVKPDTLEQVIIKTQHNCTSDRRSYAGRFIPIEHEYLVVLRRDNPFIGQLSITKTIDFDIRDSSCVSWKDLIASVLEDARKALPLKDIYRAVENHKKAAANPHFKEKVRQVLNAHPVFRRVDTGVYGLS